MHINPIEIPFLVYSNADCKVLHFHSNIKTYKIQKNVIPYVDHHSNPICRYKGKKKGEDKRTTTAQKIRKKKKFQGCHIMNKAVPTMEPWNHNSSNQEDQNPELN